MASNTTIFSNASNGDYLIYQTNTANRVLLGGGPTTSFANISMAPSNIALSVVGNTSNSSIAFKTNNAATTAMTVSGTGAVGVNTTTPAYALDVAGTMQVQTDIRAGSNLFMLQNTNVGGLQFGVASSTPSNITQTGQVNVPGYTFCNATSNVGIMNTAPAYPLDVVGNIHCSGTISAGNTGMFRNRLINGDMRLNQRAISSLSAATNNGLYCVDRWKVYHQSGFGDYTIDQVTVSNLAGFPTAIRLVNSGTSNPTFQGVSQTIEGYNIADFLWGSSNGKAATFSFWINSTVTGTYGVLVAQSVAVPGNYTYGATYAVNSASTWEYKTISITAPPSGTTWNADSNNGMGILFSFANAGTLSNGGGLVSTGWNNYGNNWGVSGQNTLTTTNGATVLITGVQLELGTIATPFEWRPWAIELQLAQRYYVRFTSFAGTASNQYVWFGSVGGASSTTVFNTQLYFPVPMRAAASNQLTSSGTFQNLVTGVSTTVATSYDGNTTLAARMDCTTTGMTAGLPYVLRATNNATSWIAVEVEL